MTDKERLYEHLEKIPRVGLIEMLNVSFNVFVKKPGAFIGLLFLMMFGFIAMVIFGLLSKVLLAAVLAIVVLWVGPALQVGVGSYSKKIIEGTEPVFKDFFSGFSRNALHLVLQGMVVLIVVLAVNILPNYGYYLDYYHVVLEVIENPNDAVVLMENFTKAHQDTGVIKTLASLFAFYISVILMLPPYLVSFFKINAFTAIDISIRAINKVILQAISLRILLVIMVVLATFLLFIGLVVAVPIMFIANYVLFYLLFKDLLIEKLVEAEEDLS